MKSFRLLVASTLSLGVGAIATACGDGGGFRAASMAAIGGTTAAAAGMNAAGAGVGGAGAGGDGQAARAGAGGDASAGEAGNAGPPAGSGGGGVGGEASGGATTNAGMAGSGVAGSAGNGGATNGGATNGGATNGGATNGGSGGAAGGASGSGGSGLGGGSGASATGGASGSGGTGTSGGPLHTCAERCNGDSDCRIFAVDQGYRCNTTAHRCERFAEPCRTSVECLPGSSFWIFDCRSDADCFFFDDDLCVDVGGVGRCARRAPSANGCSDANSDEVTLPRFGTSGDALVCANASRSCSAGTCVAGCATHADCTPERNGSVCDTSTGLCRCARDEDCGGAGVSHCNTTSGRCECADSRDCNEVPNSNACLSGRCGCSGVSACNVERTFSGTTYVCE